MNKSKTKRKPVKKGMYFVIRLSGCESGIIGKSASPTVVHTDHASASAEALRLASANAGQPFGVFKCERIAQVHVPAASWRSPSKEELSAPDPMPF